MDRARRPAITHIGHIDDDGTTVTVHGWGLGLCTRQCACHRHPRTRQLGILPSDDGRLGLASHRDGCDCCQPWTADELAAVLRDLETAAHLAVATTEE